MLCVKQYCGSRVNLTPASRLVLSITDIDNYRLLLDGLQLRCDFKTSCERLQAELDAKLDCCNAILKSVSLRRFAHLMLQVGNILNEVACSGIRICCTVVLYFSRQIIDHGVVFKKAGTGWSGNK